MKPRPPDQKPPTIHTNALNDVRDQAFMDVEVIGGDTSIAMNKRNIILPVNPRQLWAKVLRLADEGSDGSQCSGADPGCPVGNKIKYAWKQQRPNCGGSWVEMSEDEDGIVGDGVVNPLYAPNDEVVPDFSICKIEEGAGWWGGIDECDFIQEWLILSVVAGSFVQGMFERPYCVIIYSQEVCCNTASGLSARKWYKIYKPNGTPIYVDNDPSEANTIAIGQGYPIVPGSDPPQAYFCGNCPQFDLPPPT